MPLDHLLVLAVDGLRASSLGAYGNTWFATPAVDRLATESLLADACFAGSNELEIVYRSLLTSTHALRSHEFADARPGLPQLLSEHRYTTTLVTDEPRLAPFHSAFDHCIEVVQAPAERAGDVAQTALARLMVAACDAIEAADASRPQLVWIHSRGMLGPWDAPLELQEHLLEEGDPEPLDVVAPPDLRLTEADGPDAAFVHARAYAAQVMVLDACVEGLVEFVAQTWQGRQWMTTLFGTRGYALDEHGHVGGSDARLYAESLHVPWLIRFPDGAGRLVRTSKLVAHEDLLPTVLDSIDEPQTAVPPDGRSLLALARDAAADWRETAVAASSTGARSIRTPAWSLRESSAGRELFVRPDDRWETNDVAELCRDVVDELAELVNRSAAAIAAGQPIPDVELTEILRAPVR